MWLFRSTKPKCSETVKHNIYTDDENSLTSDISDYKQPKDVNTIEAIKERVQCVKKVLKKINTYKEQYNTKLEEKAAKEINIEGNIIQIDDLANLLPTSQKSNKKTHSTEVINKFVY